MYVAILIDMWDVLDVYNYVGGLMFVDIAPHVCSWLSQIFVDVPADAVTVLVDWA